MKHLCLLILFALQFQYVAGQDVESNYVVSNIGDTIFGTFDEGLSYDGIFNVVFIDEKGAKTTYRPGELRSFKKDNVHYVNREIRTLSGMGDVFLKLEVDGYVRVYSTTLIGDGGPGIVGIEEQYYLEKEGFLQRVENLGFVPKMKKYFADDPEIVSKLKSRTYLYSNTPAMVRAYNKNRHSKRDF